MPFHEKYALVLNFMDASQRNKQEKPGITFFLARITETSGGTRPSCDWVEKRILECLRSEDKQSNL